jgi:hypothetical protein
MAFVHRVEYYEPWPGTPSFHCRELLAKNEVFEKHPATTVEESEDYTDQDYNCVYPVRVLSRSACEWQRLTLLRLQAYRILVNDGECSGGEKRVPVRSWSNPRNKA